jgi:hypothetical protein
MIVNIRLPHNIVNKKFHLIHFVILSLCILTCNKINTKIKIKVIIGKNITSNEPFEVSLNCLGKQDDKYLQRNFNFNKKTDSGGSIVVDLNEKFIACSIAVISQPKLGSKYNIMEVSNYLYSDKNHEIIYTPKIENY